MYVLDTNVVSELRRVKPHAGVMAGLRGVKSRDLHISAVTIGEIQAGIEITREQDPKKAVEIESWLDGLPAAFDVLPMDARAFRLWARLMAARTTSSEDAMIAATALVNDLTVVTRNTKDFVDFGAATLDPFRAERN